MFVYHFALHRTGKHWYIIHWTFLFLVQSRDFCLEEPHSTSDSHMKNNYLNRILQFFYWNLTVHNIHRQLSHTHIYIHVYINIYNNNIQVSVSFMLIKIVLIYKMAYININSISISWIRYYTWSLNLNYKSQSFQFNAKTVHRSKENLK